MAGLFQEHGSQSAKQTRYAPIYTSEFWSGMVTQANPLKPSPASRQEERYYGSRTDVMVAGQNIEISNRSTPIRRPGNVQFSPASYAGGVNAFYEFRLFDTTTEQIDVMVDTPAALYCENGTASPINVWTKSSSTAGQTFMQYVANTLYFVNGVDQKKWVQTPTPWKANYNYLTLDGMHTYFVDPNGNLQQLTACVVPVSRVSVAASVLTLTFNQNVTSILSPGLSLVLTGLTAASFLNNVTDQTITILDVDGSTATAAFNYDDYPATSDTGICTVLEGGTPLSSSAAPVWNTAVMGTTLDNTCLWTNRGSTVENFGIVAPTNAAPNFVVGTNTNGWAVNTYYCSLSAIIDANGNLQQTTTGGKSGSYGANGTGTPTWATTVGTTTRDGTVTWTLTKTSAQMTWAANTAYQTGDLVVASPAGGVPSVFQVQGYKVAQIVGNVNAYLWPVPNTGAVGCFILPQGLNVATASGSATGNSLLFDSPALAGNTDTTPLSWSTLDNAGKIVGATTPFPNNDSNFNMVVEATLAIPEPGTYTFTLTHMDGAIWGMGNGATCSSGPHTDPITTNVTTAVNGYPIFGGTNKSGSYTESFVVSFPAAGDYPLEIDYDYWYHTGRTLSLTMNGLNPSPGNDPQYRTSGTSAPTWPGFSTAYAPGYATVTEDGGQLVWANIGLVNDLAWTQKTNYLVDASSIVDGNGYKEAPFEPGRTSTNAPTFVKTTNGLTPDNPNLIWINQGKSTIVPAGTLSTSAGGWSYCAALVNTLTDTVSNAGPVTAATNSFLGASGVTLTGGLPALAQIDPQADYVAIFRTKDGEATYNLIPSSGNANQNTSFTLPLSSYLANGYVDTTLDGDLNTLIQPALAEENTPPPAGIKNLTYHLNRIFGSVGNQVVWSSGPDAPVGNGNEGFAPANEATCPSLVTRIVPTSIGALVYTVSDVYLIAGKGTAASPLFLQPYVAGMGLLSYNALDINGTTIYLLTADGQLVSMNPGAGVDEIGFPIGDQFEAANWDPRKAYVTWHVSGSQDKALYVGDGATGWFRWTLLPGNQPTWAPFAAVVGGCGAVQSVEVTPGVHKLLVGPAGTGPVLARNLSSWQDNGVSYPASFTLGALKMAEPGQIAILGFLTLESKLVGTEAVPSVLLDEISGTFEQMPKCTDDPEQLLPSSTFYAKRFYFSQTAAPALCRYLQIEITWPSEPAANELYSLTLYGTHGVEG